MAQITYNFRYRMELLVTMALGARIMQKNYKDVLSELIHTFYFHELNEKEVIVRSLSLPLGAFIVILSAAIYLVQNSPFDRALLSNFSVLGILFWLLIAIIFVLTAVGLYNVLRASYGQKYRYLPTVDNITSYVSILEDYHRSYSGENAETCCMMMSPAICRGLL